MKRMVALAVGMAAIAISGCAGHTHSALVPEETDSRAVSGLFQHEGQDETAMALDFEGKRFEARGFVIRRDQNLTELRRLYGYGKHYDQILSRLDTDHLVYSAMPTLRSHDGTGLRCSMAWRSASSPKGVCKTDDGEMFNVRFE